MIKVLPTTVDGETIYVEVDPSYGSEETSSRREVLERAQEAFEQAKATITNVSGSMLKAIRAMDQAIKPDEFELEFGISFTAEGQAVLAKAGLEASLKVTMHYKQPEKDS